jgi:hypothetical protein
MTIENTSIFNKKFFYIFYFLPSIAVCWGHKDIYGRTIINIGFLCFSCRISI